METNNYHLARNSIWKKISGHTYKKWSLREQLTLRLCISNKSMFSGDMQKKKELKSLKDIFIEIITGKCFKLARWFPLTEDRFSGSAILNSLSLEGQTIKTSKIRFVILILKIRASKTDIRWKIGRYRREGFIKILWWCSVVMTTWTFFIKNILLPHMKLLMLKWPILLNFAALVLFRVIDKVI